MKTLRLESASFSYANSNKTILDEITVSFQGAWTGLVGPNGCGKSTLLKVLAGEIKLSSGRIVGSISNVYFCRQETTEAPEEFREFCESFDSEAISIKSSLGLHDLSSREWNQLSQGEQKRSQLACALWKKPDLFLIDEPTNHLDAPNRAFIIEALKRYKGIGILVSHDRELLNALCYQCVFFAGNRIYTFAGGYDSAKSLFDAKMDYAHKQKSILKEKSDSLKEEVNRLQSIDSSKRISKRGLSNKDHDAKSKINLAKLTGKDKSLDQKKVNLQTRIDRLQSDAASLKSHKDYSGDIFFDDEKPVSRVLFHSTVEKITLPDSSTLHLPELLIRSGNKIGIVGANGVGKTSLVNFIREQIQNRKTYYLRQELSKEDSDALQKRLRDLRKEEFSRCLQIIGRLGSDPTQIMKSSDWSSGETRKLAIALSIVEKDELLILDEPTNHLDLPSIANLETALAKSPLALLIVSHDSNFVNAVCTTVWSIARQEDGDSILTIL